MIYFNPLTILWIVIAVFCIGCFIYIRKRRQMALQAKYRRDNGHRPPQSSHLVINMPSTSSGIRYHGQEYPAPPASSSAYDQPPPFKPNEEITIPPPAYNEHKNDVRLPANP
ncbi:hypothetical protein BC941DRAFT_418764 [Chlamydoabsidia padenii]|nr:hypothetical protein BC941DRAFT_418764 [Chlamydoabsidia padenii]